jgi:hypothetical protein
MNWEKEAANNLKAEITRRGLTYAKVVELLRVEGIQMTPHAFTKKINRGGFSYAFFLQCLQIFNAESNPQK